MYYKGFLILAAIHNEGFKPYIVSRLLISFGIACMLYVVGDSNMDKAYTYKWLSLGLTSCIIGVGLAVTLQKGLI